ncbi:MAG: AEC family transporter [Pseudomonadota bacterium]
MDAVFNVALPIFAVILAGYVAGKIGILGETASKALNQFVYWVALPPLVFLAMARSSIQDVLHWPFIGAFLGSIVGVWLAAMVIGAIAKRERAEILIMQGMNSAFSNTGYMGIPLFLSAFGSAAVAPALLATVITSAIAVGLAVIGLELAASKGRHIGHALLDVFLALVKNPLVVAPMLGLLASYLRLPVPLPVANLFDLLGAAASPCALFAIGLFMSSRPLAADLAEIGWISVLKLLWQPLLVWWLADTFFPMEPFWLASAIILAALPTGALTFVVAQKYEVYVERTSGVILVSTIASVVTLSVLLAIYAPLFAPS